MIITHIKLYVTTSTILEVHVKNTKEDSTGCIWKSSGRLHGGGDVGGEAKAL